MTGLNWRKYPECVPGPERHGSPLYLVRIEYDGTEAIVYDWFVIPFADEGDNAGEWSENENVTHWIPASELLATVTPPKRNGAIFDVAEERDRLNKTLRENMPGERAPILSGQCILSFDTGVSRVKMVIQKSNREGVNNADVLLKEVFHFGIMRHGVKPLIAMLEAQGAEYPSYQDEGLKQ